MPTQFCITVSHRENLLRKRETDFVVTKPALFGPLQIARCQLP